MPVQTRKRQSKGKQTTSKDVEMTEAPAASSKKAATKKGASTKKSPTGKSATNKRAAPASAVASPASKKKKSDTTPSKKAAPPAKTVSKRAVKKGAKPTSSKDPKSTFSGVVGEIGKHGQKIKSAVLARHVPSVSKKQDPSKADKRKMVTNEIRKLNGFLKQEIVQKASKSDKKETDAEAWKDLEMPVLHPTKVKSLASQKRSHKEKNAKSMHGKLMNQIASMGEDGIKKHLGTTKHKAKSKKAGPSSLIKKSAPIGSKKAFPVSKRKTPLDVKAARNMTVSEMKKVMSPVDAGQKPSHIKTKVSAGQLKERVNAEVLKKAAIKHIKGGKHQLKAAKK